MRRARDSSIPYATEPVILCDVNVLVAASRPDHQHHTIALQQIDAVMARSAPLAWCGHIQAAVIRILTNHRIFSQPTAPADAFRQAERLLTYPAIVRIDPGPSHWRIFRELVLATGMKGGATSDAWHAALAIEYGCLFWTFDRDFARIPGLKVRNLL